MLDVRKLLAQRPLLFDGGMGTYYKKQNRGRNASRQT